MYLLRHPFATAESQLEVSFRDDGLTDLSVLRARPRLVDGVCATLQHDARARDLVENSRDPFEQHVVRWCLENRIPLSTLAPRSAHVVLYEELVMHPDPELARLGRYLGRPFDDRASEATTKPSRTDFRHRARRQLGRVSAYDFAAEWQQHVSDHDIEAGMEVLRAFELDHLYARGPLPLVGGSEVLTAARHASTLP